MLPTNRRFGADCWRNPEVRMTEALHVPVIWIPAVHAGMTAISSRIKLVECSMKSDVILIGESYFCRAAK